MKRVAIAVLALLLLSSCTDVKPGTDMYASQRAMPPDRGMECLSLVLVDDKCTRDWYACKQDASGGQTCAAGFKSCCRLHGQGSRSKIGAPESVDD
ncbi:MAG: hypothetical protein KBA31_08955 [Alphaproteobacteria bacterium]|nr:hypothetical protein [Alphaproteobacteria bacterium]